MSENGPGWIDYLNLALTVGIGGLGIYVASNIGRSADHLSQNGLIVASATLLLDDSPVRRQGGVEIVSWLQANNVTLPLWEQNLIMQVAGQSDTRSPGSAAAGPAAPPTTPAPGQPITAAPPPPTTGQPSNQDVANQLFSAVAGSAPRLFIQVPDAEQEAGAEALRRAIALNPLNGQAIIVPKIEHVHAAPSHTELRYLKKADGAEAASVAAILTQLLHAEIPVRDLSGTYENRPAIKGRTYELWFPHGQAIDVGS